MNENTLVPSDGNLPSVPTTYNTRKLGEINALAERDDGMPVISKIRLGRRVGDKKYPEGKFDYFVLDEPGVGPNEYQKKVIEKYGAQPKRLPITFISPLMHEMIPSAYKWYKSGSLFKDGTVKSGTLVCEGFGPHLDGSPGFARHFGAKDPITRISPQRDCYGESCPDFRDHAGRSQCKPIMSIRYMLPEVTMAGLFVTDTSSKISMRQIRQQLSWALRIPLLRDNWPQVPWVLFRKKVPTRYVNPSSRKEEEGIAYVVSLEFDENKFRELCEAGKLGQIDPQIALPHPPPIDLSPDELFEAETVEEESVDEAEVVLNDPEVVSLLDELEKVSGRALSAKARLLGIRAKGTGPGLKDRVLEATKAAIIKSVAEAGSKENAHQTTKAASGAATKEKTTESQVGQKTQSSTPAGLSEKQTTGGIL